MTVNSVSDIPEKATIRDEYTRCSNPNCQIKHGPYKYAYWKENGRLRKEYIGESMDALAFRLEERKNATSKNVTPSVYRKTMLIVELNSFGDSTAARYFQKLQFHECSLDWAYRKVKAHYDKEIVPRLAEMVKSGMSYEEAMRKVVT